MATDMPAEAQMDDDRWQRMWSHREHLLRVARRRSMSLEDAEDAVHEAMLRAAERPGLDEERLAAWLTTVTMRLCVDRYRQVNREAEVRTSPTLIAPGPVPVDEVVCDRAEAKWLAGRSGELPARQAEALRLRSEDLDVGQVAVRMGLSYRTVESLLARARRTLRNSLAATLGFALFLIGRGQPRAGGKAQAVAAASTAATLAVAGLVLPYAYDADGQGSAPRPAVSGPAEALRPDGSGRAAAPHARQLADATPTPGPGAASLSAGEQSLVPLSVPPLPEVALSPLPELSAPDVPTVPRLPSVSGVPALPDTPDEAAVPAESAVSTIPDSAAVPTSPPSIDAPTPSPLP
ncbi:sigma-70 family RNA polymerase sigma factor [Streptomyces sp. V4I2]|uniref:sigma-70 family RNA polymerase sigma factor n=1 Tax=Streptomyces sp. V4I2 TaxID=3042280 RepID=UPI0027845154|nr:sigma-70 family RNA polymerase sigma factor [Streptomyces sp. V4I2]MDQ1049680.1 RNA polymerase sigma factor (sigma-70 family) [Streptomyces sp. V4I2]